MKDVKCKLRISQYVCTPDCTIQNLIIHYKVYNSKCKFALKIIQSKMQICITDYTTQNVDLHYELYNPECKFALCIVQS